MLSTGLWENLRLILCDSTPIYSYSRRCEESCGSVDILTRWPVPSGTHCPECFLRENSLTWKLIALCKKYSSFQGWAFSWGKFASTSPQAVEGAREAHSITSALQIVFEPSDYFVFTESCLLYVLRRCTRSTWMKRHRNWRLFWSVRRPFFKKKLCVLPNM